ncbi:hypothetical protein [Actinocrispum sp. NPDC049592]|uniref:hypothetical protein n=1 Tax=Actinocrispum sp. NPDC049592 TaxID=3154835 RepID=UPI00343E4F92
MSNTTEPDPTQGPLAEFAALRAEIERRSNHQHNLIALQITSAGTLFAFAMSSGGRSALLLILPVTSYMLTARYISYYYGIRLVADYISLVLSPRVGGSLGWEDWRQENLHRHYDRALTMVNPLYIVFPGTALLALLTTLWFALGSDGRSFGWFGAIGFGGAWLLGGTLSGLSLRLILQITKQYRTVNRTAAVII